MEQDTPITIADAHDHFINNYLAPDLVVAINYLIKKNWNGTEAVIPVYAIIGEVTERSYGDIPEGSFAEIEDDEWDRVKPLFESMGWNVSLYKDCHLGNYEHIPERFVFTKPTEGRERKSTMNVNMNKMMSASAEKLMSRMFRKVDGVVWDLMTGKLGIVNRDNEIATFEGEGEAAVISINPFDGFGLPIPAFAQSTPADSVKVGDLIIAGGDRPKWIIEVKTPAAKTAAAKAVAATKKTFRTIDASGTMSSWNPPKTEVFGLDSGVMVVRSLMTMLPGGGDGLAGFQSSLMPMLLMGGDMDMEKLMPLMLMGGLNGGAAGGGMGNMMQTMMLMKLMGGEGGNLFGGSKQPSPFRG